MNQEPISRPPDGYLTRAASARSGTVVVLHAWWWLHDTIKCFCDRLAESGSLAFAPDLYHGKVVDTIAEADTLSSGFDATRAKSDIAQAVNYLIERGENAQRRLAVVGFSLGAYFALDLSVTDPERIRSVVVFYGTGPGDFSRSKAAYLGHFAESDQFEPIAEVNKLEASLREAGRQVEFHFYSGTGHWFFEPDRADAYDETATHRAWERTLAFLRDRSKS